MATSTWTEASIWMVVMLLTTSIGLGVIRYQQCLRHEINHSLVDSHLQVLPGVGTLSARRLTGRDTEELGGHTHRSSDLDVLAQSHTLDLSAD